MSKIAPIPSSGLNDNLNGRFTRREFLNKLTVIFGSAAIAILLLTACASAPAATPTGTPTVTPSSTATATATRAPSLTPTVPAPTVAPTAQPTEAAAPTPAAKEVKVGVSQATSVVVDYNAKDPKGYTTANTQEAKQGSEVTLVVKDGKYVTFQGFVQVKTKDGKTGFVPQDTLTQLPQLNEKNSDELTAFQVQNALNAPLLKNYGVSGKSSTTLAALFKEKGDALYTANSPLSLEGLEYFVPGHPLGVTHDQQGNLVLTIQGKEPTDIRTVKMIVSPDKPMSFQTTSNKGKITVFHTADNSVAAELVIKVLMSEYKNIVGDIGYVFVASRQPNIAQRSGLWGVINFRY